MSVTHARLKEVLHYEPETGVWTWLKTSASAAPKGSRAGCISVWGYRTIKIDGKQYRSNRLVCFYMTGEWPERHIDHENLDKADDRWLNLRDASAKQNAANSKRKRTNKSGYKGVAWHERARKWHAYIQVNGKSRNLGGFDSPEDAHAAYHAAAVSAFGEFARSA